MTNLIWIVDSLISWTNLIRTNDNLFRQEFWFLINVGHYEMSYFHFMKNGQR